MVCGYCTIIKHEFSAQKKKATKRQKASSYEADLYQKLKYSIVSLTRQGPQNKKNSCLPFLSSCIAFEIFFVIFGVFSNFFWILFFLWPQEMG
jgi:hypothetical protein